MKLTLLQSIGRAIKGRRTELNLTQEDLSLALGMQGSGSIAHWEVGSRSIGIVKFHDLATALSLEPDELLRRGCNLWNRVGHGVDVPYPPPVAP